MVKDLESKMYEEFLRPLGLFSPAEETKERTQGSLQLLMKGVEGQSLISVNLGVGKRFFILRVIGHWYSPGSPGQSKPQT